MSTCLDLLAVNLSLQSGSSVAASAFVLSANQPSSTYPVSSCSYVLVSGSEASVLQQVAAPFDYVSAASFWALAFTTVLSIWFLSMGAGAIKQAIKDLF